MIDHALSVFRIWLTDFQAFVLTYFILLNFSYMSFTLVSARHLARKRQRSDFTDNTDEMFQNPGNVGVSIIVPAHNEAEVIVDSVLSLLNLRYPTFEVIVVDDGSSDETFAKLRDSFELVPIRFDLDNSLPVYAEVESTYIARNGEPLVVLRKQSIGRRSDAINAGLNAARMPLVCMVDADSILEIDALLRVVKPFVDEPEHMVATGGVIRPANGCTIQRGTVTNISMPKSWWARIQVVEYLRSFLLGRMGWSDFKGMLIISGAFAVFRHDVVIDVGGMDEQCIGEDAELVTRIHHHLRSHGDTTYRMKFLPDPVCWTEVPSSRKILARQRRRWSRGLAEVLWKHRSMMCNPKYGRIGLLALPYFLVFELLSPIVEMLGFATTLLVFALTPIGYAFDIPSLQFDLRFATLLAIAAIGFGIVLSLAAVAVEEFSYHRMSKFRDLHKLALASFVENVGCRQLHAWWRIQGIAFWLTHSNNNWGQMPRTGFNNTSVEALPKEVEESARSKTTSDR